MYIYIYIERERDTCIHTHVCIYLYIYIERERDSGQQHYIMQVQYNIVLASCKTRQRDRAAKQYNAR